MLIVISLFALSARSSGATAHHTPATQNLIEQVQAQTALQITGFDELWMQGIWGQGETVAYADTGFDSGTIWPRHRDIRSLILAKNYVADSASWADTQGHGTHVAGLLVGAGLLSGGQVRGGAPEAELVVHSLWDEKKGALSLPGDFTKLLNDAYAAGVRVYNISWGLQTNLGAYDRLAAQIDEFVWQHPDFLVVVAAGNTGEDKNADGRVDLGSVSSPGTAKNVLTVGASENLEYLGGLQKPLADSQTGGRKWPVSPLREDHPSDNPNGLACFSARGPTADGRLKPDIVAPGTNVLSIRSGAYRGVLWGGFDASYTFSGGTSVAAPIVSSAALLLRQYLKTRLNRPSPSAAMIKTLLIHSAKDLYPGQFGEGSQQEIIQQRPGPEQGYGRLDLRKAVKNSIHFLLLYDDKLGLGQSDTKSFAFKVEREPVEREKTLSLSMVYSDAPGEAGEVALINNLDVMIKNAQDEVVVYLADSRNPMEHMPNHAFAPGQYTLQITAQKIGSGAGSKQPFALILTESD